MLTTWTRMLSKWLKALQKVKHRVQQDSMNSSSKKTSDIDAKSGSGGGLLGWFTSKSTVVVSSSTQLKDEQICDLRSKRTAHVKYEKIDGFEKGNTDHKTQLHESYSKKRRQKC